MGDLRPDPIVPVTVRRTLLRAGAAFLALAAAPAILYKSHLIGGLVAVALFAIANVGIIVWIVFAMAGRLRTEVQVRRRIEAEARVGGLHDPLTGLANRGFFLDQLGRRLALAERRSSAVFAVCCLSLQGYAEASRRLDRATADRLLAQVADAIRDCVRATDLVSRLGGENFAILIEELAEARDVNILARRLLAAVPSAAQQIDPDAVITASIGIAFKAPHHLQAGDLLREADSALQIAQAAGPGNYRLISG